VSALMFVMCVIGHSFNRAVCLHIDVYIVVSALMFVMCVIGHSVNRAIC